MQLWDLPSGKLHATAARHHTFISSVVFSPDGNRLASASHDETVILWDIATSKELWSLNVPGGLWPLAFAPDGAIVASGNEDGSITFWDAHSGKQRGEIQAKGEITGFVGGSLAYSSDGKLLAGGGQTTPGAPSVVQVWEIFAIGKEKPTIVGFEKTKLQSHVAGRGIYSVAFSPDGKLLASSSMDKTVRLWDVIKGQELKTLEGHTDFVYGVAFSPDGKLLASVGRDSLKMWSVEEVLKPKAR